MLTFPPVTPFCEKANLRGLNVGGLSVSVHVVLLLKPAYVNNSSIPHIKEASTRPKNKKGELVRFLYKFPQLGNQSQLHMK